MEQIEIAPYAPLLVYKSGYTPQQVKDILRDNKLKGLRIFSVLPGSSLKSIEFLKEYDFLEALHIDGVNDFDFTFLKHLKNLKELSVGVPGRNPIDLSALVNLERLYIDWRKEIVGLELCKKLSKISLTGLKLKDLSLIKGLQDLNEITIKSSGIVELNGIEQLKELLTLRLISCKSLREVKSINDLKIKALKIEDCSKIEDYDLLTRLPLLEELEFIDCGQISSIKFVSNFASLRKICLLGNTIVSDGDLIPIKDIKEVFYSAKKHYNIKISNKSEDALIKKNMEKLKGLFNGNR